MDDPSALAWASERVYTWMVDCVADRRHRSALDTDDGRQAVRLDEYGIAKSIALLAELPATEEEQRCARREWAKEVPRR